MLSSEQKSTSASIKRAYDYILKLLHNKSERKERSLHRRIACGFDVTLDAEFIVACCVKCAKYLVARISY